MSSSIISSSYPCIHTAVPKARHRASHCRLIPSQVLLPSTVWGAWIGLCGKSPCRQHVSSISLWYRCLVISPARLASSVPKTCLSWYHISPCIRLTLPLLQASVYSLGYLSDLTNASAMAAFFSHSTGHACQCWLILDPLHLRHWKSEDHFAPGSGLYTNIIIWIWNVLQGAHIYFIYAHERSSYKCVCESLSWPVLDEASPWHSDLPRRASTVNATPWCSDQALGGWERHTTTTEPSKTVSPPNLPPWCAFWQVPELTLYKHH